MSRRKVFWTYAIVLSAVWVILNLPRDGRPILFFLQWAGFPWTFAFWDDGHLEEFNPIALAGDIALGILVVVLLAGLCAWSRRGDSTPASPR